MGFKWIVSSQFAAHRAALSIYQDASNGKKLELDRDWMTYRAFWRGLDGKRCYEIDGNTGFELAADKKTRDML